MYKLITSNATMPVCSFTSLGHLRKVCFKKGLNSISINWLSFVIKHLGRPTTGVSFRSFGSKILMIPLFSAFLADSIVLDFWILGNPYKLLTSWCFHVEISTQVLQKIILYYSRNLKRLLYILQLMQEPSSLYVFSSNRCCIIMLSKRSVEGTTTATPLSACLINIVSSFLSFESCFCYILERFLLDFVSIFSRFKLLKTSTWWSKSRLILKKILYRIICLFVLEKLSKTQLASRKAASKM